MAVSVSFMRDNNPSNQIALETFYYAP